MATGWWSVVVVEVLRDDVGGGGTLGTADHNSYTGTIASYHTIKGNK